MAWIASDRFTTTWKSELCGKIKKDFFEAVAVLLLLNGYTIGTRIARKKLYGNYLRMVDAVLNKSWNQYTKKPQLYGHFPPITQAILGKRARPMGNCWKIKYKLIRDVLQWPPAH